MLFFLLLLSGFKFLRAQDLQWKPLENASEPHKLALVLTTVPWSGDSRSFMIDLVDLLNQEHLRFQDLQLRYVHSRTEKTSLVLHHHGGVYELSGKFSAPHVLASLQHALFTELSNTPMKQINSARELQQFVSSTDEAFVLVDFCGWMVNPTGGGLVEDLQDEHLGFEFDWIHDKAQAGYGECSSVEEKRVFDALHRKLMEIASSKFLRPYKTRFGAITSLQVLEDAELVVPRTGPWILMKRAQEFSRSWQFLSDGDQLHKFLTNSTVVVDEVDRDTELPRNKPSVLLFLQRETYTPGLRDESVKALEVVREVARRFAGSDPSGVQTAREIVKLRKQLVFNTEGLGLGSNEEPDIAHLLSEFLAKKLNSGEREPEPSENTQVPPGLSSNSSENLMIHEVPGSEESPGEPSFFFGFLEGEDQLQESFTGKGGAGPSLVVIFPEKRAYYVYAGETPFSVSPVVEFLERAFSGSLKPHSRSGPTPGAPREPVNPPFVNLDFHQVQSVPRVNLESFSELVLGRRKLFQKNESSELVLQAAWNRDALVLFTQPSCGFCKRMELAVYEAHRVILNPGTNLSTQTEQRGTEAPSFYQMDCTLNHCSSVLADIMEEEEFPTVVLFPARRKTEPVMFLDSPSVSSILQFLANHRTSHSHEGFHPSTIRPYQSGKTGSLKSSIVQVSEDISSTSVEIGVGSVLVASESLNEEPWKGSKVLIVYAAEDYMMGLIINKAMEWEQLSLLGDQLKLTRSAHLGYGGVVRDDPVRFFSLTRQEIEGFFPVPDGFFVGGRPATEKAIEKIEAGELSAGDFRFFAGYCGWSLANFQREVLGGYWEITRFEESMLQQDETSETLEAML